MKKVLLSLATVVALAFSANAQTEKGKVLFGGTLEVSSFKAEGATKSNVSFTILPTAGFFVSNNFAVGTGIGYTYSKVISNGQTSGVVVSPFARHYVNLSDQFKYFTQLAVPLAFGSEKAVDADGNTGEKLGSFTSINVNLSPGFAFFPTKKVAIEVSIDGLGYQNYQTKDEETGTKATTTRFGLNVDTFMPKLGVAFHF
jgi:outer membrane protein